MLRPVRLGAAIATALALRCLCRRPAPSRRPICRSRGLVCEGPPRWLGSGPDRSINAVYTHSIYAESYSGRTPRAAAAQGLSCSDCVGLLGHRADMRKQRRVRAAGDTLGQAKTGTAAGGLWLAMRRSLRGSAACRVCRSTCDRRGTEAEVPSFAAEPLRAIALLRRISRRFVCIPRPCRHSVV